MWSTLSVSDSQLVGTNGSILFHLEGLTFLRSKSGAAARHVDPVHEVPWEQVERATVVESATGRTRVQVTVNDGRPVNGKDPHELKVKAKLTDQAHQFVKLVNEEVEGRRQWRQAADG